MPSELPDPAPNPKLRIVVADDHGVVRDGLKRLIDSEPDMQVVGEAGDGPQAINLAIATSPDVVVMDVGLGTMSGAQATREIRKSCVNTRVLALTVHEDRTYIHEMLRAGAAGYLVKRAAGGEFIEAIRSVANKGVYVDPRIAEKLISAMGPSRSSTSHESRAELSDREGEVMRLIAQGFTNKEVSTKLGVSVKTVETYKARSMGKLGLRSRVDIIRLANERGWLTGG